MGKKIQRGVASLLMVGVGALASLPVIKTLPAMSVIFGLLGTYLVALSIEDEVLRYLEERERNKELEMRNLVIEWPGARISHLSPEAPTLWRLLRPYLMEDLLWRNKGMVPQSIKD